MDHTPDHCCPAYLTDRHSRNTQEISSEKRKSPWSSSVYAHLYPSARVSSISSSGNPRHHSSTSPQDEPQRSPGMDSTLIDAYDNTHLEELWLWSRLPSREADLQVPAYHALVHPFLSYRNRGLATQQRGRMDDIYEMIHVKQIAWKLCSV